MRHKIDKPLDLTNQEKHLILMHSILNILGVLISNVRELGKMSRDPEIMKPAIEMLSYIRDRIDDKAFTYEQLAKFDNLQEYLSKSLIVIYDSYPELKADPQYKLEVDNIFLILAEMRRRAEEIVEWHDDPFRLKKLSPTKLKEDLEQFFEAVQSNSHGAYKVSFLDGNQSSKMTYLISFVIEGDNNEIEIPMVFKDVIRDIMANARKYSLPGSRIEARFEQSNGITRFTCKDEGVGIPSEELTNVADLYYRASSGQARDTTGRGVGLTKALYVIQQLGGELWITSELSEGTLVEMQF